jgi:hypothetical protein
MRTNSPNKMLKTKITIEKILKEALQYFVSKKFRHKIYIEQLTEHLVGF